MKSSVRIAIIDSGVHASHPHVNGVAGGVAITRDCREERDFIDRLGHGTAVTAVIREKAPEAEIFAVKIFHDSLATSIEPLIYAIDWSMRNGMHLINLSLGTDNPNHEPALREALDRVTGQGIKLIAAHEDAGVWWLPGSLAGAIPVVLDWECPRDEYRTSTLPDGRTLYHASGFPRPIPGVPPERNLKGISFAVANVTGLLARELMDSRTPTKRPARS
ncbi:MAG TPA: S8 family serine peptidase [Bryobacteraceae bacterium]|nr:S8 family serine peptidase [Bryobacteraceae bacterium]